MDIAPLALVVLLAYGLLIAVSLTTWTAVSYFRQEPPAGVTEEVGKERHVPVQERSRPARQVSNDDVRGARSRRARNGGDPFRGETKSSAADAPVAGGASTPGTEPIAWKPAEPAPPKKVAREEKTDEDAFERFLRSRSDDFDLS